MEDNVQTFEQLLKNTVAHPILPAALLKQAHYVFKLSHPSDFFGIDPVDTNAMIQRTELLFQQHGATWGIGQYAEERDIYSHPQYQQNHRCVHLGLDLSAPAHTAVYAPIDGSCHSFCDNSQPGDYGPTLILEHRVETERFYTLYGHLTQQSLERLKHQSTFSAGELIGRIGTASENGGWPPHLHVQIIRDMGDYTGNFPVVCDKKEAAQWLQRCPNPNLLLKLW